MILSKRILVVGALCSLFLLTPFCVAATTGTPSFSTGTGTFYAPVKVAISDATSGAVVYYTTNGATPTTSSSVYSVPVTVGSTATLKAVASHSGSLSAVASASYTISAPSKPVFSVGAGTYYAPVKVSISDATTGAVLYYTTNGTAPTTSSSVYSTPLTLAATTTLQAIAVYPGGSPSATTSATYTLSVPSKPVFSVSAGTYYAPVKVSISDSTNGTVLYYTTNGTAPTTSSSVYSTPLTLAATTTLQAIAVCPGGSPSAATSATYTVTTAATPVITRASGTYENSTSTAITEATNGAVVYYTLNGASPTTASSIYSGPLTLTNSTTLISTTTLKAIAVYPGGAASSIATASYNLMAEAEPVNSANTTASFFGMDVVHLTSGTPWPLVPVGTLRLWDTGTLWSELNPSSENYSWVNLDKQIDMAEANNAKVLYTFGGTPSWAIATNDPIVSITRTAGVVTVVTETPHNLYYNAANPAAGQSSFTISQVKDASFDGTFLVSGTPTPTSLTFVQAGPNTASSSGSVSAACDGPYAPKNGCAEAPATLATWDAFVTALINHVGPGTIQYWEIWNEANDSDFWVGDPKLLVAMAADARRIIQSVDPKAIILSPSTTFAFETPTECSNYGPNCGSTWMNNWLAAGGSQSIDAVAFHGYPTNGPAAEQIQGAISQQQLAMNQNGVGSLPIWDTESSWGPAAAIPAESDQIAFLGRHLLLEQSMGVQRSFWYSYDNSLWGTMWSPTTGLNPVGEAYQQVAKWAEGVKLVKPCAPLASDPTTFTCQYSRPNGYSALAVWNTAGQKTFSFSGTYAQYRDLYGVIRPVTGTSVEITTSPILIETSNAF